MKQPPTDATEPVIVGHIIKTHGVSGAFRVKVMSDVPDRFDAGKEIFIDGNLHLITSSKRVPGDQVIMKLQGVGASDAVKLAGRQLTVPQTSVPTLPEGEYFHFQLLGLRVLTEEGEELGELSEILETGSNDVYIVRKGSTELLIPALSHVIREVNLEQLNMVVRLPEGLR